MRSGFPLTDSPALQVSSWNALASVRVTVRGYCRDRDGLVRPFEHAHVPTSDRAITSTSEPLPEGELLNATAFVTGAAPIVGQTFVRLQLLHGQGTSGIVLATLAADYVTAVQPLAFPGSPVRRSVEGSGAIRSITGSNPIAGAEFSETVPTGARWRPLGLASSFVTSAAAANRQPVLIVDDGTIRYFQADPPEAQTASNTAVWVAAPGSQRLSATSDSRQWNFPIGLVLLAGHRIRTSTASLQTGDDWSAPQLLVEEWLEGAA